ncbi:MAG: mechanosensitive ion channel domain-containing protein [bacterium]
MMNNFFKAVFGISAAFALQAFCQDSTPAPAPDVRPDTHQLLEEVRQAGLEEFQKKEPATPEEYREYLHLLTRLVESETLGDDWVGTADALENQTAEIRHAITNFHPPEVTSESGLDLYDDARLKSWQAEEWLDALNKIGDTRATQEANAFAALKEQQQKLQLLQANASATSPRDAWLIKLQETRVQAALAENALRSNKRSWQADLELQKVRIQLQKLNISSLESRVSFPGQLLQSKLSEVQKLENKIADSVARAGRQLKKVSADKQSPGDKEPASRLVTSLEKQLEILEYHRIALLITGQIWQSRFDLWNTINATSMDQIARLLDEKARDVQSWQPLITGLRSKLQDRWRKMSPAAGSEDGSNPPATGGVLEKALQQEESNLTEWEDRFSRLSELIKLARADIVARRKNVGIGEKMDAAATSLTTQVHNFWNTEIFTLNDSVFVNGQVVQRPSPVTLGMLLIAVAILVSGGLASAAFSRWLRMRLTARFALDANTGAILQKSTYIFLLGGISLIALAVVKIPLTIFALLGGGAAIAVGFGTQQLMNNLISGIILLFERPIRIGDIIDVENCSGTVTSIGTRCCQLRRGDGVEILIPNSVILQSKVINWTLSDSHARQEFNVAIHQEAPVNQAMNLIHGIVSTNPHVVKSRTVDVLFHDFAKDALVLRVLYWVDKADPFSANALPSTLRLAIYEAFRTEGIILATIQKDFHLDGSPASK